MRGNSRQAESTRDILLSTVKSVGFWSAVVAIVGVISVLGGGILYLTIAELENFAVSVLVIGLALLLLALILSPRAAALFLVGRRGRYGSNVLIMTLAFFAIAILVNFLLFRNPTRVDTTATQVFTLAPQTIDILENLDTTVRANAFFTPSSASTAAARQQAEDLLNEFERYSGNFVSRFIDPGGQPRSRRAVRRHKLPRRGVRGREPRGAGTRHRSHRAGFRHRHSHCHRSRAEGCLLPHGPPGGGHHQGSRHRPGGRDRPGFRAPGDAAGQLRGAAAQPHAVRGCAGQRGGAGNRRAEVGPERRGAGGADRLHPGRRPRCGAVRSGNARVLPRVARAVGLDPGRAQRRRRAEQRRGAGFHAAGPAGQLAVRAAEPGPGHNHREPDRRNLLPRRHRPSTRP